MARKRRTQADRDAEFERRRRSVWDSFRARMAAANSLGDAWDIFRHLPRENEPGRLFYTNLHMLLSEGVAPGGAGIDELSLYSETLRRIASVSEADRPACERLLGVIEERRRRG